MRSALVLGLGANVALGAFMNASTTTSKPVVTPSSKPNTLPLLVGDFQLFGCESSTAGFPTFKKIASSEDMSLDFCAASCPTRFFGAYNTDCYCGDEIDPMSSAKVDLAMCDTPCPGNDEQSCGGLAAAASIARRQQVPLSVVLSLYVRIHDDTTTTGAGTGTDTTGTPTGGVTASPTITSTITSTNVETITSCPPEVTNCPIGHKTTKMVTITTEICPVPGWHKKKIVCYGSNCAPEEPCNGEKCQHHRVICDGNKCHTEVCSSKENWHKLVICKGDDCKYHQCTGEACNTKVICYDGKCAKEKCYGDECQKKFVCKGDECGHQSCNGEDCHTCEVCNGFGNECRPQPPCNGVGCPVPPPPAPKPQPPVPTPYQPGNGNGNGNGNGGNGGNGGYKTPVPPANPVPVPPTTIPGSPETPVQTGPPVVAGATKVGAGLFGAVLGLAIML